MVERIEDKVFNFSVGATIAWLIFFILTLDFFEIVFRSIVFPITRIIPKLLKLQCEVVEITSKPDPISVLGYAPYPSRYTIRLQFFGFPAWYQVESYHTPYTVGVYQGKVMKITSLENAMKSLRGMSNKMNTYWHLYQNFLS